MVAASNPANIGGNFADRDYFRTARDTGKTFASAPFLSRVINSAVIIVSTPAKRDGKVVGVIAGSLSLAAFSQTEIAPIEIGDDGYAFLLSTKGEVIAHPKHKDWEFNDKLPENGEYKRLVQKGHGLDSFVDPKGNKVIAGPAS